MSQRWVLDQNTVHIFYIVYRYVHLPDCSVMSGEDQWGPSYLCLDVIYEWFCSVHA